MSTIDRIVISDTFQIWLSRTNELVDVINDSALLAVAGTPVPRIGNLALEGTFNVDEIVADGVTVGSVLVGAISNNANPTEFVNVNSPIKINAPGTVESLFELKTNVGFRPIINIINGANRSWQIATETSDSTSPFIIRTGSSANPQLRITQAGTLVVSALQGDGASITNINPDNIGTTGILNTRNVPDLPTSKITSGVFVVARIPDINISKVTGLQATINGKANTAHVHTIANVTGLQTAIDGKANTSHTHVPNQVGLGNLSNNGNSLSGNFVTTGDITAFGSVSDLRKKENVVKIDKAMDKIAQLNGYTFNYKDNKTPMTGVIAQELLKVLPEAVYQVDDDLETYYAVRHGNVVGLLIEGIKELSQQIVELKNGS